MANYARSSKFAGVAELIRLEFGTKVRKKPVVERALKVTSKTKIPVGSWAWLDDKTVVYRPKRWWPGHAKITVSLPAAGTVIGRLRNRNLVIASDTPKAVSFRTGRSLVAKVNANTHRMKVVIDGKVAKNFPVSLGKSGWESRSGIKVYYGSREATHTYTSDSLGLTTETYVLDAPWNTRLTPTGEFIHTARWAYARIGVYNGSHGCTNMRESDAKWIYDNVRIGDPFVYQGTSKPMESWNGPYALWNISWREWRAKSSLR
jgi:lipoprotein-anchoring transpeptidase ErfK/SrfK